MLVLWCFLVGSLVFWCWFLGVLVLAKCCSYVGRSLKIAFPGNGKIRVCSTIALVRERPKTLKERQHVFRIRFSSPHKWICFYARPVLNPSVCKSALYGAM